MKDSQKIKNNLIMGILGQLTAVVLGILVPKLVLTNYGSEVNGLLTSVTNMFAYVAIVEAGIAAASCQALYKPIAENNKDRVNEILSATNQYYYKSGLIYFVLILLLSAVYPVLVHSEIPYTTIVLVILFNGFGNVVNYFFHGKYLILLKADGKNYIRTGLETLTNAAKQISKIALIALGVDVVLVQLAAMLASFIQTIYVTLYIKKHYSWIDLKAKPDKSAIAQSKNVFIHEINYLITSNVDTVLLTLFSTLQTVSVYSLYNLLFGMVNRALRTVREALEFKIAHLFHTNKNEFSQIFRTFETYYLAMAFSAFTITMYFITPFIRLYTADVTDAQYVDAYIPILFVIVNLLACGRYPMDAMVHISGHFKQTQKSAVMESCINLAVSIVLVQFFGICGALLGTVISSLYRVMYLLHYVNKKILNSKLLTTLKSWGIAMITFALIALVSRQIQLDMSSYGKIFVVCIPYSVVVVTVYMVTASMGNPKAFRFVAKKIRNVIAKLK